MFLVKPYRPLGAPLILQNFLPTLLQVSDSPAVRVVVEAIKSATLCCNAAIDAADDDDADDDDDSAEDTLDDNESTVASKLVTRLASGLLRFLLLRHCDCPEY
jgi:hypothetical protein